jgi:hypothetical protein
MSRFVLGLDLGQAGDSTGFAVVEASRTSEGSAYAVRHLHRFRSGTPYAAIAAEVQQVIREGNLSRPCVVTDITAVGPGILNLLRPLIRPAYIAPITITTGAVAVEVDRIGQVPKRDLVTILQIHLQQHRLKIAAAIPDADVLVRELTAFRARVTAVEGALDWRDRPSDDLALAIALACWWSERHPPWTGTTISVGRSMVQDVLDKVFPELVERPPKW